MFRIETETKQSDIDLSFIYSSFRFIGFHSKVRKELLPKNNKKNSTNSKNKKKNSTNSKYKKSYRKYSTGWEEIVKLLLREGSPINVNDNYGMSPLHFAGKIYTLHVSLYGILLINVIL